MDKPTQTLYPLISNIERWIKNRERLDLDVAPLKDAVYFLERIEENMDKSYDLGREAMKEDILNKLYETKTN